MAWRRPGDKPLSEPRMENLLMHICVTRPQWVNSLRQSDPHMCQSNELLLVQIFGFLPICHQVIIWINPDILSTGPLDINFSDILMEIQIFSLKKMHLERLPAKWQPFYLSLTVLIPVVPYHPRPAMVNQLPWFGCVQACNFNIIWQRTQQSKKQLFKF